MSFLQPFILFALPLIGLPILIHFVNQNRHRTVYWAATMFLLQARRMVTGMARLRYLLILLARMLVIAGLLLAVSRPMAGGWLGITAGGVADTVIVILDRSCSMEEHPSGSVTSKRQTALQKLSQLLEDTASASGIVLLDSVTGRPVKLRSAADLTDLPEVEPTATSADIPALLQSAMEYIVANQTGRTDVWVCSDLRRNDWNPDGGRWPALRQQLEGREGIRFYLLSYAGVSDRNLAVSVSGVHRRTTDENAELVMDLKITRQAPTTEPIQVPLTFVVDGARSTEVVELTGSQLLRNGHLIPLDREATAGWGRVELPADDNPEDNQYGFVYSESAVQKTVIVSDQPAVAEFFRLAAATSSNRAVQSSAEMITSSQAAAIAWKDTALIIWQAALPAEPVAARLAEFAASGRSILFFPPATPDDRSVFGFRWGDWITLDDNTPRVVSRWRTDADLLANGQSGTPMPAGELQVRQYCPIQQSEPPTEVSTDQRIGTTVLATLDGGAGLLTRVLSDQGAIYFCSTLPLASHSNLVSNGVVFYIMIQRALAQGAGALGSSRNLECGSWPDDVVRRWKPANDDSAGIPVSQRGLLPGIFSGDESLFAVNRPAAEDAAAVLTDEVLQNVLGGLDFTVISDDTTDSSDLASEVWRAFLMLMIVAMLAEAVLCVPDRAIRPVRSLSETG